MNPKKHYYRLFDSRSIPNEETKKIRKYFSDLYFFLLDPITGKPFLGQAVQIMERLVSEENGNLTAILGRCREVLSHYVPSEGVADLDRVDWQWIGIEYLYPEAFNCFTSDGFEDD
ncbi:MAG: hypothetical protein EWV76_03765 [Microcystis novacekii Mn_MB_F_20050700_S1]|uniref:Uncharacterized protein n=1 Tax=Microcystis novacekii Mn_MB_F_20050700_S1D TaxID=2486266 RepID=A0A552IMY6_9CHRO|nr:MAG: hypothetical protein EWV54_17255 [Microcystis novacekii Mn_MB_F_20050700_S1D]TRU91460.1 MAG: hypothetical protein EWV76_03765 [Microcystis novacekii Mn_MB_F_20050700_S1]